MFNSIISSGQITVKSALITTAASIFIGFLIAFVYSAKTNYTKSFKITLIILPLLVQTVIMMVNGNLGTGVAIAGAFALIRFRSAPATALQISAVFFAMAVGLANGMGYVGFSVFFSLIAAVIVFILLNFAFDRLRSEGKVLHITVHESLEFNGVFDDIIKKYTSEATLDKVKTTAMGSMYELTYSIKLKTDANEKSFIDEIRIKNSNLPIMLGTQNTPAEEL